MSTGYNHSSAGKQGPRNFIRPGLYWRYVVWMWTIDVELQIRMAEVSVCVCASAVRRSYYAIA
jgi:hypothetical protein